MVFGIGKIRNGDTKKMTIKSRTPREYDNYPTPEKTIPLTNENRKEYLKACEKVDEVVDEILAELRRNEAEEGRKTDNGVHKNDLNSRD